MKHRWFLIAAYGWLLLQPPPQRTTWTHLKIWLGWESAFTDPGNREPDISAPLSKWYYLGSFDSAKECEAANDKIINKRLEQNKNSYSEHNYGFWPLQYANRSRCIPAMLQLR